MSRLLPFLLFAALWLLSLSPALAAGERATVAGNLQMELGGDTCVRMRLTADDQLVQEGTTPKQRAAFADFLAHPVSQALLVIGDARAHARLKKKTVPRFDQIPHAQMRTLDEMETWTGEGLQLLDELSIQLQQQQHEEGGSNEVVHKQIQLKLGQIAELQDTMQGLSLTIAKLMENNNQNVKQH